MQKNYIKENGGILEIEYATSQEYFKLDFSDPNKRSLLLIKLHENSKKGAYHDKR